MPTIRWLAFFVGERKSTIKIDYSDMRNVIVTLVLFLPLNVDAGLVDRGKDVFNASGYVQIQYLALAFVVASFSVPFLLYRMFFTGSELMLYMASRYGRIYALIDSYVPVFTLGIFIASCIFLDWIVCVIVSIFSFFLVFFTFVIIAILTKGNAWPAVRNVTPIF